MHGRPLNTWRWREHLHSSYRHRGAHLNKGGSEGVCCRKAPHTANRIQVYRRGHTSGCAREGELSTNPNPTAEGGECAHWVAVGRGAHAQQSSTPFCVPSTRSPSHTPDLICPKCALIRAGRTSRHTPRDYPVPERMHYTTTTHVADLVSLDSHAQRVP